MTTCKHPSELNLGCLITNEMIFQVYRWVINPYVLALIFWISNYPEDVPPAGTDGMKIKFPMTGTYEKRNEIVGWETLGADRDYEMFRFSSTEL